MTKDNLSYQSFFENSVYPMLIIAEGLFTDCNSAAVSMLGYENKKEVLNHPPYKLSPEFQPDGCSSYEKATEMIQLAEKNGNHQFEWEHLKKDGSVLLVEVSLASARVKSVTQLHVIWRDLSRRARRNQEFRESEERFRQIFEASPDPIILTELNNGVIIDVNHAFETVTGISRLEALGHNTEELDLWVNTGLRTSFREELFRCGEINNYEADFLVKGGQCRTCLISSRIIKISLAPFMLTVVRDVTKEKEVERVLVEMNKMKSEFISTAAHELRTPITGIMGYTELLSDQELSASFNDEQKQAFRHEIYGSCERLAKIVDDILDVSRIESGQRLPLEMQSISMPTLLDKVVNHFTLRTKRKISVEIKPGTPESIKGDIHRLRQVMDNLLSNAIKYSPNECAISIVVEQESQQYIVRVIDQGVGMSKNQIDHVFDKFYRVDRSNTAVSGLGLGMSIVRQIIEDHGGTIQIESILGEGTNVSFTLPNPL